MKSLRRIVSMLFNHNTVDNSVSLFNCTMVSQTYDWMPVPSSMFPNFGVLLLLSVVDPSYSNLWFSFDVASVHHWALLYFIINGVLWCFVDVLEDHNVYRTNILFVVRSCIRIKGQIFSQGLNRLSPPHHPHIHTYLVLPPYSLLILVFFFFWCLFKGSSSVAFLLPSCITKTRLYNFNPLKSHFYIVNWVSQGNTLIFLFLLQT